MRSERRARQLLDARRGKIDRDAAQAILRDHANEPDGICRHEDEIGDPPGKRLQSVFSVVMDLRRRDRPRRPQRMIPPRTCDVASAPVDLPVLRCAIG